MRLGTCNVIRPYRVRVKTVARYKIKSVGYKWLGAVCRKKFLNFDKNFSVTLLCK